MALEPSNVSGSIITWEATSELRYAGRRRKDALLEQLWKNRATNETEWREIPFVHVNNEGE